MDYIKINKKGTSHKQCEDAVYISKDNTVFCVADGVSNSRYSRIGANNIVNHIGKWFESSTAKIMLKYDSVGKIRENICKAVEQVMTALCKHYEEHDADAFASTFLALIKTDDDNITLIHAGDGVIFGRPNADEEYFTTILSYPDNTTDGRVYSVGSAEQVNRMRVLRIRGSDYKSIMLCTDGFSEAYLVPSFQAYHINTIIEAFDVKTDDELETLVEKYHINERHVSDDISCIIVKTSNDTPACKEDEEHTAIDKLDSNFHVFDTYEEVSEEPEIEHRNGADNGKAITETEDDNIPVNPIDHDGSRKENRTKKKAKPDLTVPLLSALIIIGSLVMIGCFSVLNKKTSENINEISSLKKQVSSISEELSSVKDEFNKKSLEKDEPTTDEYTDPDNYSTSDYYSRSGNYYSQSVG